jgi:hypothetical protein
MSCATSSNSAGAPAVTVQAAAAAEPNIQMAPITPLAEFAGAPTAPSAPAAGAAGGAGGVSAPATATAVFVTSPASGIVGGVLARSGILASDAQAQALATIATLAAYGSNIGQVAAPSIPLGSVTVAPAGAPPTSSTLTPNFPGAPQAPLLSDTPLLSLPEPPAYNVPDLTIIDIALPDPFTALLPTAPELAAVPLALEPDFTLPAAPTLFSLALPEVPTITLPLFTASPGEAPDAPDARFAYAEVQYQSALLSSMTERLASMSGDMHDTGLTEDVEQAIWERAAEREALLTHRAAGEALRLMKMRGFAMPEAAMVRTVQQALQGGLRRTASLRRDILIKQAQLRQQNFKFATDTMVALQARLLDQANAAQARALESAKAMVNTEIQLFNAKVALYNASVSAFSTSAQVFRSRLEGALASIEIYKAQLSGQEAIGEINVQKAIIYKEQIAGVSLIAGVYKTRVDAARQVAESNKVIVEGYRARVSALESAVLAKSTEYDMYSARIKGQAAKVAIFAGQNRAFSSRVQAFEGLTRAKIGAQDLRFKQANEFPLELYKSQMDAYRIGAEAAVDKLRSTATLFDGQVRAFATQEGAKVANVEAQVRVASANAQASVAQAELMIEAARSNLQLSDKAAQSVQANMRTAGQLGGQLAAAAIAAQHVHASITESGQMSVSQNDSITASTSVTNSALTATSSNSSTNTSSNVTTGTSMTNAMNKSETRSVHSGTNRSISRRTSVSNSTRVSAHNATTLSSESNSSINNVIACEDITTHSDK